MCARDGDWLECLIQAVEYRHQGVTTVQRWIDTSFKALESETARTLARAVLETDPLAWELLRGSR